MDNALLLSNENDVFVVFVLLYLSFHFKPTTFGATSPHVQACETAVEGAIGKLR